LEAAILISVNVMQAQFLFCFANFCDKIDNHTIGDFVEETHF